MISFSAVADAEDRSHFLGLSYVYWREYQPDGTTYLWEDGVRGTGGIELRWPASSFGHLVYSGSLYGSLTWHRTNDPTHIAVPSGHESTPGGQIGTKQELSLIANGLFGHAGLQPYVTVAADIWYRPLDYYEIWQVPSVQAGLRVEDSFCQGCRLDVGIVRTIGARNLMQTSHSPWNGESDTNFRLGDNFTPSVTLQFPRADGSAVRFHLEGYRFGRSDVYPLSGGGGVFQPRTTTYIVGVTWLCPY